MMRCCGGGKTCKMCGMPVRDFPPDSEMEQDLRNADLVKDRRHFFAGYAMVFSGSDFVDFCMRSSMTGLRSIAVEHGQSMMRREVFHHVLHEKGFEDSSSTLYRFKTDIVALNKYEQEKFEYDLVVVGAGSGGITAADFGAELGARTMLIERHGDTEAKLGGDCTWFGCVPSKAIIHASKICHAAMKEAAQFGLTCEGKVNMQQVKSYIEKKQAFVYSLETPESVEKKGVKVMHGEAKFVDAHTMEIMRAGSDTVKVRSKYFLLCTGARPKPPNTPGLEEVPYDTYESIWKTDVLPEAFAVVGTGVIGCEIAQTYCRLGSQVTLIGSKVLPREEPSVQAIMAAQFKRDGIHFIQGRPKKFRMEGNKIAIDMDSGQPVVVDKLLVATGRATNVEALNLEAIGVKLTDANGIVVNNVLQTSVPNVYAAGDVTGGPQFTHYAGWQAWQAVRNCLLPGSSSGHNEQVLPAATFTSPEVASVGLRADIARKTHGEDKVRVCRWESFQNDRCITDDDVEDGFIEMVVHSNGQILGCTIVNERAGELISEVALAMQNKLTVADIAHTIHPYPAYSFGLQQMTAKMALHDFLHGTVGKLMMMKFQKHAWQREGNCDDTKESV